MTTSTDLDQRVTHHYADVNGVRLHYARAGSGPLIVGHRPAVEAAVGVAASLVHPYIVVGPQLAQVREGPPVGVLQREPPLHADDGSTPAARSKYGGDGADVAPVDRAVGCQGQDITGQHVHPTQAAPTLRPDRSLTVVSHGVGHLLSSHDRASSSSGDRRGGPRRRRVEGVPFHVSPG